MKLGRVEITSIHRLWFSSVLENDIAGLPGAVPVRTPKSWIFRILWLAIRINVPYKFKV
jgi:hypothetical protein